MVKTSFHDLSLPTHACAEPDRHPAFLDRRVYQGSRGTVYPMPFISRIEEKPTPKTWKAVTLENDLVEVLLLPEIGGRIHGLRDKTTGEDLIYRQSVIKPALVGLAGPWISGGIEFNWPQHHRPATYLPCSVEVEKEDDGAITVWMGSTDPLARLRSAHGVRLRPGSSLVEIRARLLNPTEFEQTFLWWMNIGIEVHEAYQSFFPEDVKVVADHAKRASTTFPLSNGLYYGVDYGRRAKKGVPASEAPERIVPPHLLPEKDRPAGVPVYAPNDLRWYANIPVPTSYMAVGSRKDFFGGYDHKKKLGLVHVADRHVAPGKKQWTWGNHAFGRAWDRLLSPDERPYIELMAGVFTDNQPDFSFLAPGEERRFSQYLYALPGTGPAQAANEKAAMSFERTAKGVTIRGVTTESHEVLHLEVTERGETRKVKLGATKAGTSFQIEIPVKEDRFDLQLVAGSTLLLAEARGAAANPMPLQVATEPPAPEKIASSDELVITGLHLRQYRHATRRPELWFEEALRRDASDQRARLEMGRIALERGLFLEAEGHLRKSWERATSRNPNPKDGEIPYLLGLALRETGDLEGAEFFLAKAEWNRAWKIPAKWARARLAGRRGDRGAMANHLEAILAEDPGHVGAIRQRIVLLREEGRTDAAHRLLAEARVKQPFDAGLLFLDDKARGAFGQDLLDFAWECREAGRIDTAIACIEDKRLFEGDRSETLATWLHADLLLEKGAKTEAKSLLSSSSKSKEGDAFAGRIRELGMLQRVADLDALSPQPLWQRGNLLWHLKRPKEAMEAWKQATRRDPSFAPAWRNLGLAQFNAERNPLAARASFDKAGNAGQDDAQIAFERDALASRLGTAPEKRLRALANRPALVSRRDDLLLAKGRLLVSTGRYEECIAAMATREFQPWEGGEGQVVDLWHRGHVGAALGRLAAGNPGEALALLERDLSPPASLGECRHLLVSACDLWWLLGETHLALGDRKTARSWFTKSARFEGDFQSMAPTAIGETTAHRVLSLRRMGRGTEAKKLVEAMKRFVAELRKSTPRIDYFATSLPQALLFVEDLEETRDRKVLFLEAQIAHLEGRSASSKSFLSKLLARDPAHLGALQWKKEAALFGNAVR